VRIGILGGGQLARMIALAGHPLGLTFRVLEPASGPSAAAVAEHVQGDWTDPAALDRFADGLDVVTYEFENVPVTAAARLAERLPVLPRPRALEVAQDRLVEKQFFRQRGIDTAPFLPVDDADALRRAAAELGLPAVLKTRREGYDGKGQLVLREEAELEDAWLRLGGRALILEAFVPFRRELSVLAVRDHGGEVRVWPITENVHRDGILRTSRAPAPGVDAGLRGTAERYARTVLEGLDYVGVLAIELFDAGGSLLANEMAPRVHNSGHWTIEGAVTSQFENHARAVAGLPLGSTEPLGHAVMVNLIGELPPSDAALRIEGAHLHLYGKEPRPGRKLGHVTCVGADPGAAQHALRRLSELMPGPR
jgi:5-(carboxyamino)imidazole ribonucleotide synthase